jgi:pyruvate dehydrogenase E1 component alpha subunit
MAADSFFPSDSLKLIKELGREKLLSYLRNMLLIRNFEVRAEAAYLTGQIGGFFHSYIGQEAIQTAAVGAIGLNNWWTTSYRCHALALLLQATPRELMAELFGKATGNAKGRGGSMHFFTRRMLGGFGIVGGQIPVATGSAFSIKYLKTDQIAICFFGEGAVAQGIFHESLNLASLWNLPILYVIENNEWGMGTSVSRAIAAKRIAEQFAPSYGMNSYTLDGMDFFNCYAGFRQACKEIQEKQRPLLIEVLAQRFRGHSISDPGAYRSKEELAKHQERDPLLLFFKLLSAQGLLSEKEYEAIDAEQRAIVLDALEFAKESPWPDLASLGEDVLCHNHSKNRECDKETHDNCGADSSGSLGIEEPSHG